MKLRRLQSLTYASSSCAQVFTIIHHVDMLTLNDAHIAALRGLDTRYSSVTGGFLFSTIAELKKVLQTMDLGRGIILSSRYVLQRNESAPKVIRAILLAYNDRA